MLTVCGNFIISRRVRAGSHWSRTVTVNHYAPPQPQKKWEKAKKDNANGCITSCCKSEKKGRKSTGWRSTIELPAAPPTTTTTTNGKEMCCGKYFLFHFHYVHEFMMYLCVHNVRALARAFNPKIHSLCVCSSVLLFALSFHSPYIIIRSSWRIHATNIVASTEYPPLNG